MRVARRKSWYNIRHKNGKNRRRLRACARRHAGQLAFTTGARFDFKDAAAEEAFKKAAQAAGAAGVVVASAKWVYMEDATVGDLTTAMPKPSKETSKRWSMRTCDNDTTLRLFLAPDPSKEGATGFAALAAELLGK